MTCEACSPTLACIPPIPSHRVADVSCAQAGFARSIACSLHRWICDVRLAGRRSGCRSPLGFRHRRVLRLRPTLFNLSDRTVWRLSPDSPDHTAELVHRDRTVVCSTFHLRSAPEARAGLARSGDRRSNQRSLEAKVTSVRFATPDPATDCCSAARPKKTRPRRSRIHCPSNARRQRHVRRCSRCPLEMAAW